MRLFLAINLEPDVRRAIVDATAALRTAAPTLSWVDETRLHLTLKFLGEQSEEIVPALSESVSDVAWRHRQFTMHLGEIGAFPNFRRARVVWMGIHRDPRLELLHHDVELACETHGLELEGRAFRPHLTLARVKDRTNVEELRQLSRASKKVDFEEESAVQSIDLMKSNLGAAAKYECLHSAPLRSH
ncbi:MAG TPA: RNA 2',3'-cyclic phosphodiesterase [Gemmatimonadaceae bacterium]